MSQLRVPAVSPKSRAQIEVEAIGCLKRWFPDHLRRSQPLDVLKFFDHLADCGLDPGVEVLSSGVEGITLPTGEVLLSEDTYLGAAKGQGRHRFTVVHECCHGLFHRQQLQSALVHTGRIVLARRSELPSFRDPEWQANTFASFALMPAVTVEPFARRYHVHDRLAAVMDTFGVSRQAGEIRLRQLQLL